MTVLGWLVRPSRAYKSTLRAAGWDLMRVKDDGGTYWCASVDLWWVGVRAERRLGPASVPAGPNNGITTTLSGT